MKFLKSEVFRLFSLGFVVGALVIGAPIGHELARSAMPSSQAAPAR